MSGAFDWLDNLSSQAGQVLGKAVDAAGAVATAKIEAEKQRALKPDQTPVPATSPLQTASPGFGVNPLWVFAGVAAVVGIVLLVRKG